MKLITVIDASSGEGIFPCPVTEAQFDRWYDHHADWRAVRDLSEVSPLHRDRYIACGPDEQWLVQD